MSPTNTPAILTTEEVYRLNAAAVAAGFPADMPRLVGYRISGNRTVTEFCLPGCDAVPTYELRNGAFVLVQ